MNAKNNQSWLDIAIELAGDATAVIEYAIVNNCDFSDEIKNSRQIQQIKEVINKEVQTYFKESKLKPASGLTAQQIQQTKPGTGLMTLENNFIIQ